MNMKTIIRLFLITLLVTSLIANYCQFVNRLKDQRMLAKMIVGHMLSLTRVKTGKLSLMSEEVMADLRKGVNYLVSMDSMDQTSYTIIGNVRANREFSGYGFSAEQTHEIDSYLDRNK
jgi:hypothetical protein